jgi:tetratricopeptide (TPR) repeat protein
MGVIADLAEETGQYDSPELADLIVYLSCRLTELRFSQPGGLPAALDLLGSIHTALEGSTRQPYLLVGVHELELQIYAEAERFDEANESYRKALDLLGPEQALYRFDVHSLATLMLFQRQVPSEQRYVAFSTALAELPADPEPFDRLIISYSLARATRRLATLAHVEGLPAWPGIRQALQALEQARPLHREYGDSFSLEMADSYQKDLEYLATKLAPVHTH